MNDKQEVAVWQPSAFDGQDLLPLAIGGKKKETIGRELITSEDLILPAMMLLQGMSEPVTKGMDGAKPGLFYLSGAEEIFEPPLRVLLVAHTKSRSLFPKDDRAEHAGLEECLSRDGKTGTRYGECDSCPHKDWDNEHNKPPACSESHNFIALTPLGPAVIRFARTSFKSAKKLLTAWTMSDDPLWAHPTIISAKQQEKTLPNGRKTVFYSMETKWVRSETVPPHAQEAARVVYEQVKQAHDDGRLGTQEDFDGSDDVGDVPF
jgi:hypothetical protein